MALVMWLNAVGVLFVLVTFYTPTASVDPFWIPKRQLFLMGILMLSMFPGRNTDSVPRPLIALGLYISAVFSYTFIFATQPSNAQLFPSLLGIFTVIFMIRVLQQSSEYGLQRLATWLCVGILLLCAFSLLQWAGLSQWLKQESYYQGNRAQQMYGTLGNNMLVGNFLAMGAPFLLMFKRLRFAYPVVALTVLLTGNQAGLLALAVGLIIWLAFTNRVLLAYSLAALLVVGCLYGLRVWDDGGRILMWTTGIDLIKANSVGITGFGMGAVEYLFRQGIYLAPGIKPFHPHNELIFLFMELGMIGVGLMSWLAVSFVCRVFRAQTTTLLAGYSASLFSGLVICMFSFPTQVPPLLMLLILSFCGSWTLAKENVYA